jgi:hypothetical protein
MPDDVVIGMVPDPHSAIVALTHDPKLDDMALLEALKSPAFYVGALGSRVNNTARKARLLEYFDLSEDEVGRLHGPVGLHIGSRLHPGRDDRREERRERRPSGAGQPGQCRLRPALRHGADRRRAAGRRAGAAFWQ